MEKAYCHASHDCFGEKPYGCLESGQKFTWNSTCYCQALHDCLGEKPYKCQVCVQKFSWNSSCYCICMTVSARSRVGVRCVDRNLLGIVVAIDMHCMGVWVRSQVSGQKFTWNSTVAIWVWLHIPCIK